MNYLELADNKLSALEDGLDSLGKELSELVEGEKGSGLAICKILHAVNYHWEKIEHNDYPTFDDFASGYTGYVKATTQRRICSWEFVEQYVPMRFRETVLKNWNVSMLSRGYRVAVKHKFNRRTGNYGFLESGNEIGNDDWLALSECVDMPMLIERLDKITKKEPNKNRVSFSVDMTGAIWFYRGKKEQVVIGNLFTGSDDLLIQDGVTEAMEKLGAK